MENFELSNLNVDWLKKNHQQIHFFGLGFIQVKLNSKERLHFYTTKYQPFVGDSSVHDHRYNFESTILKGYLKQVLYHFTPGEGDYELRLESCKPDFKSDYLVRGQLNKLFEIKHKAPQQYTIYHQALHRVYTEVDTITLIRRSDYKKELASVVQLAGEEKVCPFSRQVPEEELWDIVAEMLIDIKS